MNWLNAEIKRRGITQSELARQADVSHSIVSLVMSGKSKITYDFCASIARAFSLSPDVVFRIAGLLPPTPNPENIQRLIETVKGLDDEELSLVLDFAEWRYNKSRDK